MIQAEANQETREALTGQDKGEELLTGIKSDIKRLNTFSNRGLWALSLFMIVCMMAWNNFAFLPLPGVIIAKLGAPPQPQYISILLLLYTFSAIILSLSRMMGGIEHKSSFCHVGYLTGFFLFYYVAKALNDNYWAVFGAGITILGIESYRIWSFCKEAITKKTEQLQYVQRNGRMPPVED
jgi:hypothetical protein